MSGGRYLDRIACSGTLTTLFEKHAQKDSNLRYTPSPPLEQRGTKHRSYIVREAHSEGVKSLEIRQGFIRTRYQGYTIPLENKISAPKDARLPLFATSA
ncbi:hypothetical protein BT67DRAFT_445877 [Trichocladium antarcticum]|uniref:Uncharacterized protein n=1 Tax=Trichocladium antarcticum TaxID=1450529 RepID=A0AAN6UBZ7_9PEZI|nr:hypothetical protein BT67DRAFT_445877 [Trichocladium antarcticum]